MGPSSTPSGAASGAGGPGTDSGATTPSSAAITSGVLSQPGGDWRQNFKNAYAALSKCVQCIGGWECLVCCAMLAAVLCVCTGVLRS